MTVDDTVDAEVIEPMAEGQAKKLDKRIRLIVGNIQTNWDKLADLVTEAKAGHIHLSLGFDTWTTYLTDAVQVEPRSVEERRELVALLSGEGLSQRAIADMTGASASTVNRDTQVLQDETVNENDSNTTGLDGREYKRKPKEPKEPEPQSEPKPKPKTTPITEDFKDAMEFLVSDVHELVAVVEDERYDKSVKIIAKRHLNDLQEVAGKLEEIVDSLMVVV